jgi:hypothetical protein
MESMQQPPDGPRPNVRWATPPRGELERFSNAASSDSYVEVGNLLTQFHRSSPVRSIAEGLLGNTYRPDTSTVPLFSALANNSSHHWREQVVAAWALARVPLDSQERDAAAGMLLDTLERDDTETLWERFLHGLLWGYGTMLPLCLIWSILICREGNNIEWADVFPQMLFALGSLASVLTVPICLVYGRLNNRHNDSLRAAAAESLGRLHVFESIGPLAARLFDSSTAVGEASACALMEILPRLAEEDYGAIDHQSVSRLAEALCHPNTLLVFKVLEALKKVGTGHTLPAVERVVREGKTRQLQETAKQVATVLEDRRRREREARHLMRPTGMPQQSIEDRPRIVQPTNSEEQLQTLGTVDAARHEWL